MVTYTLPSAKVVSNILLRYRVATPFKQGLRWWKAACDGRYVNYRCASYRSARECAATVVRGRSHVRNHRRWPSHRLINCSDGLLSCNTVVRTPQVS
jgi:hypothetical protein